MRPRPRAESSPKVGAFWRRKSTAGATVSRGGEGSQDEGCGGPRVLLQSLSQCGNSLWFHTLGSHCCCAQEAPVPEPCPPELRTRSFWEQPGRQDSCTCSVGLQHAARLSRWAVPRAMGNVVFGLSYLLGPTDCQSQVWVPAQVTSST